MKAGKDTSHHETRAGVNVLARSGRLRAPRLFGQAASINRGKGLTIVAHVSLGLVAHVFIKVGKLTRIAIGCKRTTALQEKGKNMMSLVSETWTNPQAHRLCSRTFEDQGGLLHMSRRRESMDSRGRQQDGLQGSLDDIHSVSFFVVGGLRGDFVLLQSTKNQRKTFCVTPANAKVTFPMMTDVTLNCVDVATTNPLSVRKKNAEISAEKYAKCSFGWYFQQNPCSYPNWSCQ